MTQSPTTTAVTPEEQMARLDGPIHLWFNLTYSNYLVLHRSMMQSMPVSWQERAVALFDELDGAFPDLDRPESFIVTAATVCRYRDLSTADMADLDVSHTTTGSTVEQAGDFYYDRRGDEHHAQDTVLVPLRGGDPVPHYNRGRTFIEPVSRDMATMLRDSFADGQQILDAWTGRDDDR